MHIPHTPTSVLLMILTLRLDQRVVSPQYLRECLAPKTDLIPHFLHSCFLSPTPLVFCGVQGTRTLTLESKLSSISLYLLIASYTFRSSLFNTNPSGALSKNFAHSNEIFSGTSRFIHFPLTSDNNAIAGSRRNGTPVMRARIAVRKAARGGYIVPGTTRWGRIRNSS